MEETIHLQKCPNNTIEDYLEVLHIHPLIACLQASLTLLVEGAVGEDKTVELHGHRPESNLIFSWYLHVGQGYAANRIREHFHNSRAIPHISLPLQVVHLSSDHIKSCRTMHIS